MPKKRFITAFIVCGILALSAFVVLSTAPKSFPIGDTITIIKGQTLSEAAALLKKEGIIRSELLFRLYTKLAGTSSGISFGTYLFENPESALRVAYRLSRALYGTDRVKVTIPEGLASADIAVLIKQKIPEFDAVTFKKLAKEHEGYLYPDTYFFDEFTKPEEMITQMLDNFDKHARNIRISSKLRDKTFEEILIMASLVEEEAKSTEDRKIIAGILWKRIEAGMPLQVDATFFYTLGKTSAELTMSDLASDSPYNLYKNKGLPPTPIDNPSLDSIKAAANPVESDYWFFLAGNDGKIRYSETHDEHVANKFEYLN